MSLQRLTCFTLTKYYRKEVAPAGVGRTCELKRLHFILVKSDM
jgi:hypothetical protein